MKDMTRIDAPLHGSYAPEDVTFLLKPVALAPTDVAEKERRIQSGEAHYSEMISEERRPDARYMEIFEAACAAGLPRIGREISGMADALADMLARGRFGGCITLCSLVRAGVPYGVLLHRELLARGIDSKHFGVSIIRDKGLDPEAMAHAMSERPVESIVFVDGWTGKGAISNQLQESWRAMTGRDPFLAVLADPCGRANLCGSRDDWLIPSGILGGNVSGLVSRSILNRDLIGPGDFHGCIELPHMADIDRSRSFVDAATEHAAIHRDAARPIAAEDNSARYRALSRDCVAGIARAHAVTNMNRIKPGIAEATRAVLRRRPERVFVRTASAGDDPDLSALLHLCETDDVPVTADPEITGPYRAVTLIGEVS